MDLFEVIKKKVCNCAPEKYTILIIVNDNIDNINKRYYLLNTLLELHYSLCMTYYIKSP